MKVRNAQNAATLMEEFERDRKALELINFEFGTIVTSLERRLENERELHAPVENCQAVSRRVTEYYFKLEQANRHCRNPVKASQMEFILNTMNSLHAHPSAQFTDCLLELRELWKTLVMEECNYVLSDFTPSTQFLTAQNRKTKVTSPPSSIEASSTPQVDCVKTSIAYSSSPSTVSIASLVSKTDVTSLLSSIEASSPPQVDCVITSIASSSPPSTVSIASLVSKTDVTSPPSSIEASSTPQVDCVKNSIASSSPPSTVSIASLVSKIDVTLPPSSIEASSPPQVCLLYTSPSPRD